MNPVQTYKTDVVIAGGGLAGIVAALELLDSNKKVLLLDRDIRENFGGLARESFGGMFFVGTAQQRWTGISDNPALALQDWLAYAEFNEADHWPRQWAEYYVNNCTELGYKWLRKQGIRFLPVVNWVERKSAEYAGNSVPRFHIVWGSGKGLSDTLVGKLLSHRNVANLSIMFRHKVTTIEKHDARVVGLRGVDEEKGQDFLVNAESTIIASGGICGSIDRIKANWYKPWGEAPEIILNGSHPYADGLLHDAAENIGANLTHMNKQWLYSGGVRHPKPRMPNHGLSIISSKTALWLDSQGRRFGPEPLVGGFDARRIIETVCKQEHKYSWQVLNRKIAVRELAISGSEHNPALREKKVYRFLKGFLMGAGGLVDDMLANCEDFIMANSVDELTEKMQAHNQDVPLDRQEIARTIKAYDASADEPIQSTDKQRQLIKLIRKYPLDKFRTCVNRKIDDPAAYPLIAIKEHILSRKTLGGIQTDLGSRVLTDSGDPIPGLFAVGEAAGFGGGGVHGLRSLEGTFLGGCVLSGRLAANTIKTSAS